MLIYYCFPDVMGDLGNSGKFSVHAADAESKSGTVTADVAKAVRK